MISLLERFPEILKYWHDDNPITPDKISYGSAACVWIQCPACPQHAYQTKPNSMTTGNQPGIRCPFCAGKRVCPCGCNSLKKMCPEVAASWHPTRNGDVTAAVVTPFSNHIYWFKCNNGCGHHAWPSMVSNRTKGQGCPICSTPQKAVCPCGCNSLATLFPDVARQWHPDNDDTPETTLPGCGIKKKWRHVSGCGLHEWWATPNHRTAKDPRGCPFCTNLQPCPCGCNTVASHPDMLRLWGSSSCSHWGFSKTAIDWLKACEAVHGQPIRTAESPDGEFRIPGTKYHVDGYCEATQTVWEYLGDFWHGNPAIYTADQVNQVTGKTMSELYQKTVFRLQEIVSLNFKVVYIWENDNKVGLSCSCDLDDLIGIDDEAKTHLHS